MLVAIGAFNLERCLTRGYSTYKGVSIWNNLDAFQQKKVLANRSLSYLHNEKICRAVIIDGASNTSKFFGSTTFPFTENIYEHCETRILHANNSKQFCQSLEQSSKIFDQPIDVLAIYGHSNPSHMLLAKKYSIIFNDDEQSCMNKYLSSDAQVFLVGCKTASKTQFSITDKLTQALPKRQISGVVGYFNPLMTTSSFTNGRFELNSSFPEFMDSIILTLRKIVNRLIVS